MKTKVIVTRNFKEQSAPPSKYCVLRWGDKPEQAVETESLVLLDAEFTGSYRHAETRGLADFGCGIVAIGEMDDAYVPTMEVLEEQDIHFNGADFVTVATDQTVCRAQEIRFGTDRITALAPLYR